MENQDPRLSEGKPIDSKNSATVAPNEKGDLVDKIKDAVKEKSEDGTTRITPENAGPWTVASLQTIIRQNDAIHQQLVILNTHFKKLSE